jgi:DNA-binding MarR family transcriptional regulator
VSRAQIDQEVGQRTPFVGALMLVGWQWVREQVFDGVRAAGYDDLNPAHVGLVRYPTLDGLRPIDIAARMQITKQSVHDLLGHMEQRGYLVREEDPTDRRARVVRLTYKGRQLERDVRAQAAAAEAEIAAMLGERRFRQLRDALQLLADELNNSRSRGNGPSTPETPRDVS